MQEQIRKEAHGPTSRRHGLNRARGFKQKFIKLGFTRIWPYTNSCIKVPLSLPILFGLPLCNYLFHPCLSFHTSGGSLHCVNVVFQLYVVPSGSLSSAFLPLLWLPIRGYFCKSVFIHSEGMPVPYQLTFLCCLDYILIHDHNFSNPFVPRLGIHAAFCKTSVSSLFVYPQLICWQF